MKRFLSLILAMLMVTALFVPSSAAEAGTTAPTDTGMSFSQTTLHPLKGEFTVAPMTIEARVYIPDDANVETCTIFSNNTGASISGKPNLTVLDLMKEYVRLTYVKGNKAKYVYFEISPKNLRNQTFHIAVVNTGEEFLAYLNGGEPVTGYVSTSANGPTETKADATEYAYSAEKDPKTFYVGGSLGAFGGVNSIWCRYHISEIAVYSVARGKTQIEADAKEIKKADNDGMLAWLKLSTDSVANGAPDLSGNGHHMGVHYGKNGEPVFEGEATFKDYAVVTFNPANGSPVSEQYVVKGETATEPTTDPSYPGYKFIGWYNGDAEYDFTTSVTTDLTLTATWAKTYTVTFDANGGSGTMDPETDILGEFTLPECSFDEPTGKKFEAWEVGGEKKDPGATIDVSANTEVKALWVDKLADSFTVTFRDGEKLVATLRDVKKDTKIIAPPHGEKEGFTFLGWFAEGATDAYNFEETPVTSDLTLTAQWKINTYKVTFINEGAEYADADVDHGQRVNAPDLDPSKTGHAFGGWFLDLTAEKACEFPYTVKSDLTFTAKWVKNAYTVKFINDGKETTTTVSYGDTLAQPEKPTKTGYRFLGWFASESATTPYDFTAAVAGPLTLTARWEVDTTAVFTVTFDTNGGDLDSSDPQSVKYGEFATNPGEPWKKGCEFIAWYNGNAEYAFDTPVTGNLTLTAMWKVNADHTGMAFPDTALYPLASDFADAPMTIEARIYIPANVTTITSKRVLFSNNVNLSGINNKRNLIELQIMQTCFRLTYAPATGNSFQYVYFNINPKDLIGQTFHIAVVNTGTHFLAYLNGKNPVVGYAGNATSTAWETVAKPMAYGYSTTNSCPRTFYVGGSEYSNNSLHFLYPISEIVAYSVARSASQIKEDAAGTPEVNEDMLVWLQLSEDSNEYGAADLSLNNNNMKNNKGEYVGPAPKPDITTKPSENIFTSPLFALAALYAQRFDVVLVGENCSISGDTMIKYKRSGVVEISVDEGYELVDVMLDGKPLGPVTKVDVKKVTRNPELVVITRAVGTGE